MDKGRIIVRNEGIGMTDKEADDMVKQLYDQTPYERKETGRTLIRTIPWEETSPGELGINIPGIEIEVDGDEKTVRVYKIG